MKYTITIEDVAAAELVKICQMLTQEISVTPKADVIPINKGFGQALADHIASGEQQEVPTDQWKHLGDPRSPEDTTLATTYNKLASPEHAKIDLNTAPAGSLVEIDSNGLIWDERIHAGTKAQNKDGSWKQRRGVDDATIATVEAELRAKLNAPAVIRPNELVQGAAPIAPPAPDAMFNRAPLPPIPPVPPAPPQAFDASAAVGQPAPAPAAPVINFATLTARITNGYMLGKIDASYAPSICARVGAKFAAQINTMTDIMNNPEMIVYADSLITSDNAGF